MTDLYELYEYYGTYFRKYYADNIKVVLMSVLTITPAEMHGQRLNDSPCPLYHCVPFEPQILLDDLGVQKLT